MFLVGGVVLLVGGIAIAVVASSSGSGAGSAAAANPGSDLVSGSGSPTIGSESASPAMTAVATPIDPPADAMVDAAPKPAAPARLLIVTPDVDKKPGGVKSWASIVAMLRAHHWEDARGALATFERTFGSSAESRSLRAQLVSVGPDDRPKLAMLRAFPELAKNAGPPAGHDCAPGVNAGNGCTCPRAGMRTLESRRDGRNFAVCAYTLAADMDEIEEALGYKCAPGIMPVTPDTNNTHPCNCPAGYGPKTDKEDNQICAKGAPVRRAPVVAVDSGDEPDGSEGGQIGGVVGGVIGGDLRDAGSHAPPPPPPPPKAPPAAPKKPAPKKPEKPAGGVVDPF